MLNPYLKTFFEEKELPAIEWDITDNEGTQHFIGNEIVIEHIGIASNDEQEKIAHVIRQIDFKNGDVNHFLKHLAGAIVNG